jgi:5-methylcytosine-specific restriction endonuclease McrA
MTREVLLLNASEEVISVIDWQRAVNLLSAGKATKPFNYNHTYSIKTSSGVFELPAAIMLVNYIRIPFRKVGLSKKNIIKRDNNICQYCSCKLTSKNSTVDHVLPKSRGGLNSWTNLVASCHPCNLRKGNRTPQEANMRLLRPAQAPGKDVVHIVLLDENRNKLWERWLDYK